MGHNVLKPCFPMIGLDLHGEMAVPLILTPSFPHVCFSILNGVCMKVDKTSKTTQDGGWMIVRRSSDIGNFIPHIPIPPVPSFLFAPIIFAFSGSKSYFGPASVLAEKKVIGCALIFVVDVNGNCWDILSAGIGLVAPTGFVITWNTVETSLTWGDILGGFIAMAIDAACTAALSYAGGKLAGKLSGPILGRILGTRLGKDLAWRLAGKYGLFAMPMVTQILEKTLGGIALFVTGSPLGHSLPGLLGSDYDGGSLGGAVGYDLGNAITGDGPRSPSTPASTSPSSPAPSPAPTPGPTPTPSPTGTPATGNGSTQHVVGTTDGNVPSPAQQQAQRGALQQPAPARTPTPGQPGGDLANQPVEEW